MNKNRHLQLMHCLSFMPLGLLGRYLGYRRIKYVCSQHWLRLADKRLSPKQVYLAGIEESLSHSAHYMFAFTVASTNVFKLFLRGNKNINHIHTS